MMTDRSASRIAAPGQLSVIFKDRENASSGSATSSLIRVQVNLFVVSRGAKVTTWSHDSKSAPTTKCLDNLSKPILMDIHILHTRKIFSKLLLITIQITDSTSST